MQDGRVRRTRTGRLVVAVVVVCAIVGVPYLLLSRPNGSSLPFESSFSRPIDGKVLSTIVVGEDLYAWIQTSDSPQSSGAQDASFTLLGSSLVGGPSVNLTGLSMVYSEGLPSIAPLGFSS